MADIDKDEETGFIYMCFKGYFHSDNENGEPEILISFLIPFRDKVRKKYVYRTTQK